MLMLNRFKIIAISLLVLTTAVCHAQQFQIMNLSQDNAGKVTLAFKINPKYAKERYTVQVFSSHDNYRAPLQYVTGDTGGDIEGSNKTYSVEWDAKKELVTYSGQIQLELRGEVTYTPVHSEDMALKVKRNKSSTLHWTGGNSRDQIKIDLMRHNVVQKQLASGSNSGRYNWTVDRDISKGTGYQLRLTNLGNQGETYETNPFTVRGKSSPLVWAIPLIGGAAAAVMLTGGDGGGGGGENGGGGNLPNPPFPGN